LLVFALSATAQVGNQVSLSVQDGIEKEDGIRWVQRSGDGGAYISSELGREGFYTDTANAQYYLYMDVDDAFIKDGQPTRELWISIEYLDVGTDAFSIQYDSGPNGIPEIFRGAPVYRKTDTGEFRTAIYHLTDASFNNRQQGVADFRIDDRTDGPEFITKVVVSKTPLELPNAGAVSGTVKDANSGAGVPNCRIVANNGFTTVTDQSGAYTLPLQPGSYEIRVVRSGYMPADPVNVTIKAGTATDASFSLKPYGKDTLTISAKGGSAVEDGLKWVFIEGNTDGFGQVETRAGRDVIRTGPDTEPYPDGFLYIDVDDNFLFDGEPTREVYITMEYLDEGTAPFTMHYDSMDNQWAAAASGARTNTGQWKTFTWHLTDVRFANREQNVADFRIYDSGGGDATDLYISKVTVSTKPPANFGTVTGKVTNSVTGAPVAGATVKADSIETAATNGDGVFTLQLPEGTYTLTASGVGFEPTTVSGVKVTAGETNAIAAIAMKPTAVKTSVSISAKDGKAVSDGIKWVFVEGATDGFGTIEKIEGRDVIRTGPDTDPFPDVFFYGDVDDTFIFGGKPTREVWITVEYLDVGTGQIGLDYDAGPVFPTESFKGAERISRTDTGTWMTYTWHVTDASFANREQGVADFRIGDGGGGDDNDLYISRVSVSIVNPNAPPPPAVVKGDVNGDGTFNVADVSIALRLAVKLDAPNAKNPSAADLNGDGAITIAEVTQLLRAAVGLGTLQ